MNWRLPIAVFAWVLAMQLLLVARLGTDIPYQDQWDLEGRRLYPAWRDGTWKASELFAAHNEHRIVWTKLLDLALFEVNGQWDPLVQLAAGAVLRAGVAALLAGLLAAGMSGRGRFWVGVGVAAAFLPHVAWENALWGFQSSVYFVILFSLVALALLGHPVRTPGRLAGGLLAGLAALLAMGAGAFVPAVLLGLAGLHAVERRRCDGALFREAWPALALLAVAIALRSEAPAHAVLRAATSGQFFNALGRAMAWPHTAMPWAALVLNLPLMLAVGGRMAGRRRAANGEDFALLAGGWSLVAAGAMAWSRGGGDEFDVGVTVRYVDFLLLLPIANVWCLAALARNAPVPKRPLVRVLAGAWGVFLVAGWLGVSAQVMRGFILPRVRDRDLPVRLAVEYQKTGDSAVYAAQPAYFRPHPNLQSVRAVLNDPRMRDVLPPSFQPNRPVGPLSRVVRMLRGQATP